MTPIEEAQIRVAKAEDAKQKLQDEITNNKKYGSIAGLDQVCSKESSDKKGGARDLRRSYNKATKELRLAKSDLKRMRNEENQAGKVEEPQIDPEYIVAMSRLKAAHLEVWKLQQDPIACYCSIEDLRMKARTDPKAKGVLADLNHMMNVRKEERKKAAALAPRHSCWNCSSFSVNNWEKPCRDDQLDPGDLPVLDCPVFKETYASQKAHKGEALVEIEASGDGVLIKNVPEEVAEGLGEHGTGKVLGPTPDGKGMIVELAPDAKKKTALQVMNENAEKAEASPKRPVQMDLEGKKAKAVLSGCIKVPPERFVLETTTWTLKGPKDEVLDLVRTNQRPAVKARVQKGLRAKKDAMINDGDFDLAVEQFVDEIMRGIIHRLPEDE